MPDHKEMTKLMTKRLPRPTMALLIACGVQGANHGFQVFLVGGMVRDVLRDRISRDPDLVVQEVVPTLDASARYAEVLAGSLGVTVSPPSQFGTIKVVAGGLEVDIASARRESYASPGALPDVRAATIEGDLGRRDFTINAIGVDLGPKTFGNIVDIHGGQEDLNHRVIGVIHDGSFADDPTRLFRAVRYETRLNLRMTMMTEMALRRDIGHLAAVSGDRIRNELERIFVEDNPAHALSRADELGMLQATLPALTWTSAMTAAARQMKERGPMSFLALLASSLSREDAEAFAARINATGPWSAIIHDAVTVAEQLDDLAVSGLSPSGVYRILEGLSPEAVSAWAALSGDATAAGRLREYADNLRYVRPALDGDALLALGVPQGPRVGELLRELLHARLDGQVANRADEEALVRDRL
ncbi:MAG: hypothetical protein OXT51_08190 [Chloroflexota bacterium]|nr:hypothetical protein [Chloroflexota bacterium]